MNLRILLRNNLIHDDHSIKLSSEQIQKVEEIMPAAQECVEFLKTKFDNIINTPDVTR